jgi:hypothetical protein
VSVSRKARVTATLPGASVFLRRIWERIKAHKVVQWTLAYLAVAYTLLHGVEMQALFRALTDPTFGAADRQEALALVEKLRDDPEASIGALWILKDYDQMAGFVTDSRVFWLRSEPGWLKSPARKRMIEQWRIPAYWRAQGFPPQCQPVGAADFACP